MNRNPVKLALVAVAFLALLGIAAQASASQCYYYPYEICVQCCDEGFEECVNSCQGPGCLSGCYSWWVNCQSGCVYAPRVSPGEQPAEQSRPLTDAQLADQLAAGSR